MFPTPLAKTSRQWQISYQVLLPIMLIIWLLPLIAVANFSIKPESDFVNGNYWGIPSSFEAFSNYGNGLVTIAGPGEFVISAFPGGGWAMCAGTSFSAPWVAGLLAVLVERGDVELPGALAALSDGQKLTGHHNTQFGFGGVDAVAAWEAVQ